MATELDQSYHGWPHQELLSQEDSQDAAIAQMLDQGSISFGRYAVESLAWEKRSVFSHNRCQEELEKLKSPGLVAQKKAYFEAYYKKIRDLKALQASEQTELPVDYGGDDNGSCQNGEVEDENFGHETLPNQVTNFASACSKEDAAESALEMEIEVDINFVNVHLNNDMMREPAVPCSDSSRASFEEIDVDKNSGSRQCMRLDPDSSISYDNLQRTDIEDTKSKKNCGDALQMEHMSKESTLLDSPRGMEEIELFKSLCSDVDEWNAREARGAQCSVDSGTSAELNGRDNQILRRCVYVLPLVDNHTIAEAKVSINEQMENSSVTRIKESSVIRTTKIEQRTKSEAVKASQRPNYLLQKTTLVKEKNVRASNTLPGRSLSKNTTNLDSLYREHKVQSRLIVGKEGNKTHLSRGPCNILPTENKDVLVSSNRPLKESHSSVILSHPFSSDTRRRAVTPGGIRESRQKVSHPKSSNGSIHASQSHQLSMRSTSVRRYTANGVNTASLEKKSHHGGILKTASVLNNHSVMSTTRNGLPQRQVAWSINLPAVSKYSLTRSSGFEIKEERPKEGKANGRSTLLEGTSKFPAVPLARTNKTNLRKHVPSQTVSPLLGGRKSRQEVKPWR